MTDAERDTIQTVIRLHGGCEPFNPACDDCPIRVFSCWYDISLPTHEPRYKKAIQYYIKEVGEQQAHQDLLELLI